MEEPPHSNTLSFPSSYSVVAPYAAASDLAYDAGQVQYTGFITYLSNGSPIPNVSSFIRNETGANFYGTKMMVSEWSHLSKYYNGYRVRLA